MNIGKEKLLKAFRIFILTDNDLYLRFPKKLRRKKRMDKEELIKDITRKLAAGIKLDPIEITMIRSALRESKHCFQKPYYEVIYHDKYGNAESRVMEPIAARRMDMDGYSIQEDRFDLNFRRIVRDE